VKAGGRRGEGGRRMRKRQSGREGGVEKRKVKKGRKRVKEMEKRDR
jgi:hypothetical protein